MYKISNFSLENGVKRVQLVYAWGLKKVGEFLSREFIVSGYWPRVKPEEKSQVFDAHVTEYVAANTGDSSVFND